MGKLSNIDKSTLVKYSKTTNISTCLLCEKELKGYILGNIKRHYETLHNYSFSESVTYPPSPGTSEKSKTITKNQFNSKLNKSEFLKCCVGMVTVTNIPVRIFNDERYFKKIIEPYENQFNINLNPDYIEECINLYAMDIKNYLRQNLSKKMLSLKVDVASRAGSTVVVISVQYMKDFQIIINTIGVIILQLRHTAVFIKDEILKCLQEFEIDLTQIYSATTGNEEKVLEALQLIQQDMLNIQQNKEFLPNEETENDDNETRLKSVMPVLKCATHTIQTLAEDFWKDLQTELNGCRKIVKRIRESMKKNLKPEDISLGACLLSNDDLKRWDSTLQTMQSLLINKNQVNNILAELSTDLKIDWKFIEYYVTAFAPLMQFNENRRAEQYIIGDFYRDWLVCEAKLRKSGDNALAIKLLKSMTDTKRILLDNVAFMSGIYLDPRFNFLDTPYINDEQKRTAVAHILRTHVMPASLIRERYSTCNDGIQSSDDVSMSTIDPYNILEELKHNSQTDRYAREESSSDPYNILEEELNNLESSRCSSQNNGSLRQKLVSLEYGQRLPFATDVLAYWKSLSAKEKDLSKLAEVILAVPSNQTTEKQTENALSLVIGKHCKRLSAKINNLLIVKLNFNLIDPDVVNIGYNESPQELEFTMKVEVE